MKKISLLSLVLIFNLAAMAGNGDSDKIYQKLKGDADALSLSLSKEMIDFFDLDIDLNGKEKWITGDFSAGKLLVISEKRSGKSAAELFLKSGYSLVDIEDSNDKEDGEVYLFVSRSGKKIKEAHFIVVEDENMVLLSIFGDIKVTENN